MNSLVCASRGRVGSLYAPPEVGSFPGAFPNVVCLRDLKCSTGRDRECGRDETNDGELNFSIKSDTK